MTLKIKLNHILLGLALIMLMLSTNAVAIAQVGEPENGLPMTSSREFTRSDRAPIDVPGGPGHLMLTAYDFQPRSMDSDWRYFNGRELYNPGVTTGYYYAPVHLPDGATINKVVLYYFDNDETNLQLSLFRLEAGGTTVASLAAITPTGDPGYSHDFDTSISDAYIDLANYPYALGLVIPAGGGDLLTVLQVRIDYEYPTFLPTVRK